MPTPFILLDFETTGLSPRIGDRAIEVAELLVEDGKITDKFQPIMNPGKRIPSHIENYTGITNSILRSARLDFMQKLMTVPKRTC